MIGKVGPRGSRVSGLIYYLFGPGRNEEHTDPHLVAGWRHPAELEPPLRDDGHRDFRHLTGLLQQPQEALGDRGFAKPVWHCSVRAAPGDRMLSDDEWAQVACDIMHRTGLAPYGQDDDAVRWVAVRHAADHIHIVAMLARQDGTRPRLWNDYYRVGEACRAAEQRFGLRQHRAPRPYRRPPPDPRGVGEGPPPRPAGTTPGHTPPGGQHRGRRRVQRAGVLRPPGPGRRLVRKRFSTRNPGEVTGYAVALPADTTQAGGPVWYSGGKLAPDLTLPKLRHRWAHAAPPPPVQPSLQPNATRSGSTPPAPPRRRGADTTTSPSPTRTPPPTPPGPPPTPCTRPRRPWAAGCSARPPTPTTAPPAPLRPDPPG